MTSNNSILYHQDNGIGYLILNDPPKNEMNTKFFKELNLIRTDLFPKLSLKGLIVTGQGNHFSSGANVDELKSLVKSKEFEHLHSNLLNLLAFNTLPFPVVAAIKGSCFGSALELALTCHYRIAASKAIFAFPEVSFNLMPGCGGTYFLPKIIGKGRAIDLIISGRFLLADEAWEIGLVDVVVHKNEVLKTAKNLIEKLYLS